MTRPLERAHAVLAALTRPAGPKLALRANARRRPVVWLAAAASILLALASGFLAGVAWQRPTESHVANVPFAVLRSPALRGAATVLEADPDSPFVYLILAVDDARQPYSEYRLEIRPAGSASPPRTIDSLRLLGADELTVQLPREQLPAGSYELDLAGLSGGVARPVARYELVVEID